MVKTAALCGVRPDAPTAHVVLGENVKFKMTVMTNEPSSAECLVYPGLLFDVTVDGSTKENTHTIDSGLTFVFTTEGKQEEEGDLNPAHASASKNGNEA